MKKRTMKLLAAAMMFFGPLLVIVLTFTLGPYLLGVLWEWTIPDLFPGAVASGAVARTMCWFTGLKIVLFLTCVVGIATWSKRFTEMNELNKKLDSFS